MATKNEFGIWMDSRYATIVGNDGGEGNKMSVIAHVQAEELSPNAGEVPSNSQEKDMQGKFFKAISGHLENATRIHLTGTGTSQEQFIHYLADTPQFKNTITEHCTSNKMSDERLLEFMEEKLK